MPKTKPQIKNSTEANLFMLYKVFILLPNGTLFSKFFCKLQWATKP